MHLNLNLSSAEHQHQHGAWSEQQRELSCCQQLGSARHRCRCRLGYNQEVRTCLDRSFAAACPYFSPAVRTSSNCVERSIIFMKANANERVDVDRDMHRAQAREREVVAYIQQLGRYCSALKLSESFHQMICTLGCLTIRHGRCTYACACACACACECVIGPPDLKGLWLNAPGLSSRQLLKTSQRPKI
jgi:hypothetical protein